MAYKGPEGVIWVSCNEGWQSVPAPVFVPATKVVETVSEYDAIGGQISRTIQTTSGPAIEVNQQYFADEFAFCSRLYGYGCNTEGSCPMDGLQTIVQGQTETVYEYSETGELQIVTTTNRNTRLSAAQPFDWRSTIENGFPTEFKRAYGGEKFLKRLYNASIRETVYSQVNGVNEEFVTTRLSAASRGIGINAASIDAAGPSAIISTERRKSTTTSVLSERPNSTIQLSSDTVDKKTTLVLTKNGYTSSPGVAGPYILEKQVPVPLILSDLDEIEATIDTFGQYVKKFTQGDLYGLQIAESLRGDIANNWEPGMSFRYADPANNKISAMRMDACAWGVTQDEAIVVTNGIWTGFSSGTLEISGNLQGNVSPNLPEDPDPSPFSEDPDPDPSPPISINNDKVSESFFFTVDAEMNLSSGVYTPGGGVIPPLPTGGEKRMEVELTTSVFCTGSIVGPGDLVETDGLGGLPADSGGQIIIDGATIVDQDVFSGT